MNFLEKTVTIKDSNVETHTRQARVWIGEGTGLAYVQTLDIHHHLMKDTYNLTHVASGYAIPYRVNTPEEAQMFLEKVASIFEDRWNCDLRTITKRLHRNRSHIMAQIELAHYDSSAPHVDYFLYAATEDDVCGLSHDAADKDPLSAENAKIALQLLSQHPEATKAVMACVADADGIHNILRTFERAAVVEQI
jgi:hypothetical protein